MNWQKYLAEFVLRYRMLVNGLSATMRKKVEQNYNWLLEPCQIELMKFGITNALVLTSTNNEDRPDMEFIIHEKPEKPSEFMNNFIKRNPELKESSKKISEALFSENYSSAVRFAFFSPHSNLLSIHNLETMTPPMLAMEFFGDLHQMIMDEYAREQREVIQNASQKLKEDLQEIPEGEARTRLEERVKSIEDALLKIRRFEKIDEKMASIEGEIRGIRTLVGVSTEFQDWRVMASDVETMKKTHVAKDLFASEIKRLDQRIDSLKEIKFWSKRTIVDIILAIIATASTTIVTLIVAGILKF